MIYTIPYLLLLVFFAVTAFIYAKVEGEKTKRNINIGVVSVFFFFFAFRGYLYTDWQSYMEFLDRVKWDDVFEWNPLDSLSLEPGFAFLTLVCKSIYNNYSFLVVVCISIDTLLFLRFLKRRKIENLALIFMLFITFEGLTIMFNLLRNAISIFIFLNALEYIEKRKPLPYFFLCVLASSFHVSSIMFLPLYFFLHKKLNKWLFLCVALLCMVFFLSRLSLVSMIVKAAGLDGLMGGKVDAYTDHLSSARVFSITHFLENYGLVALVFLYYDEITEKFPNHVIVINCLLLFLIMYFVLAEFKTLSSRLATLFIFSYWVLWVDVTRILHVYSNKAILSGTLFLYCAYILVKNVNVPCQEYDNILFGAKSYQERQLILNRTYEEDE